MSSYSLTHLTGRKRNVDRKVIIATVKTSKAGFLVSTIALAISVIPTAIAVMIFGMGALVVVPPLFIAAGLILFRQQSTKGLHLPIYKSLLDKKAAKNTKGQILICGVPIQKHSAVSKLAYSSEPITPDDAPTETHGQTNHRLAPVFGTSTDIARTPRTTEPSAIWS